MEKFREDMRELKLDVKELVRQSAVHNELLRTHEARSLELKTRQDLTNQRIEPIEKHVAQVSLVLKIAGAIAISVSSFLAGQWLFKLMF